MITTGSKFLIGSTVLAAICAVAYGVTQDGVMGTVGLVSAALALAFIAAVNLWTRDSNVFIDDAAAVESCAAGQPAPGKSIWPLAMGLSGTLLVLGLVTYQAVFTIGLVLFLASGGEWMLQAWAERASADARYNSTVRERLAGPLEFPLVGAVAVGILVYAFSRVMLWLSKTNTVVAFAIMGSLVLAFAFFFAFRTSVPKTAVAGISAVAVVGIVAGGVAAGVDGERDIHEHETTADLEDGEPICLSEEETHADENGSQTVSLSANVAARITLSDEDELSFTVSGFTGDDEDALQLPRSNPSNIIFINESSHERRLSVDLGEKEVTTEDGAAGYVDNLVCTTLLEEDGQQLLTLTIGIPSAAQEDGYHFFVPGVDSAEIELVVP